MTLKQVSLDDKYTKERGTVYMTGNQALVRLPLLQKQRDLSQGLNTAGYITGYRGSPIGTYDMELSRNKKLLDAHDIVFQPGVNEDLAATSVWGTQQIEAEAEKKYDGVFAIWYGKGPGVFRSGDAIKHGSFFGASLKGGVLLIAGDDHVAKSSTIAHYSEPEMIAHGSPVLYPSTVQEVIDYGLIGWALSRYSGAWVTLKVVNETIEGTATVELDPEKSQTKDPQGLEIPPEAHFVPPTGGLGPAATAERMAYSARIPLVKAFARLNKLDRITLEAPQRKLGIVSSGKVYQDILRAFQLMGIDEEKARALGISLYKVAMIWPLEDQGLAGFAEGHEELLVIEEKQPVMEPQIADQLFNWPDARRPRLIGKRDEQGQPIQKTYGGMSPHEIVALLRDRLAANGMLDDATRQSCDEYLASITGGCGAIIPQLVRIPYFCSGCPHNSSTKVPEGSQAMAGIGCHAMAGFMNRNTSFPTQMGGEGHNWVGLSHFVDTQHRFQNLGDGTYTHSGLLAVHAAAVQKTNITYKILYNDAVAMTGGQPAEGQLTPQQISEQVTALGAKRVVITTDDPDKYRDQPAFAKGAEIHHRRELDRIQRELREVPGVTVLIHDQTCAAEKRRRRKRGQFPDPQKRMFINEQVCEACGDCSVQANCVSLQTRKTDFGNKRVIDQSNCNKDYRCVDGFCPSFVTVLGGKLRKAETASLGESLFDGIPQPVRPEFDGCYTVMINGIGGTGVVTIGAVLGMAAHLEDKSISIYDMTGFAQKGGAVQSHLRIGHSQSDITSLPIGPADADLIIGCDLVVTASESSMRSIRPNRTKCVVNSDPVATSVLQLMRDFELPTQPLLAGLKKALQDDLCSIDATKIANALTGNSIAANMFLVGFAFQKGWLPLSEEAILKAIEINKVSIDFNQNAFRLGRVAAHDISRILPLIAKQLDASKPDVAETAEQALQRRIDHLTAYQNAAYAAQYVELVEQVRKDEQRKMPGRTELSDAVVRNFFKLMAYKDEYEVARLYTDGKFRERLEQQFEGDFKLRFNLAPPILNRRDPQTGHLRKQEFGPWVLKAFGLMAKLKGLRGTAFDPFGYTAERRQERQMIADYRQTLTELLEQITASNYDLAVKIAELPGGIRGYGHVKEAAIKQAEGQRKVLLADFKSAREVIASDKQELFYEAT
ncbi:indolepyruvate ferredoxin oxidoreductase family protein [Marinobacterium mangrovicola]|uniref:Indolepyruvate ferredoxin oxidoreductase n=1 Tax=Marinobacterium mangrovicola TaxID=1476959 RepID=A0A4R1GNX9_9GAMM|nr:indolepyruvate ferredoxin oxidoreductase family protein [Marinobacterium mangrovicola]TCK09101.1 indolepyruvate ferredoxin oxidoreductase [Marinobacterium mangrovicola]